jgi:hypothetical protein
MRNINNPRHKLNFTQVEEARRRYEDYGWKTTWISIFLQIHRSSVLFHIRTNGWVRRVQVINRIPDEIVEIYREKKKIRYLDKVKGTYDHIRESSLQKTLKNCQHMRWIKRCSLCGEILESDSIKHDHPMPVSNATTKLSHAL